MTLKDMINEQRIHILSERDKKQVLLRLIGCAVDQGAVHKQDAKTLEERIFHREKLMSTGMGIGIAIPHVRYEGVKKPLIVMGIQPRGISDYASIDDIPVQLVVMIIMGENQQREYIDLLSHVVAFLKSDDIKAKLLAAPTPAEAYRIIKEG
jgi:PTS system nitrogen regulatory IIA component